MTLHICPNCHARIHLSKYNTDFVHECKHPSPVLNTESIVKMGDSTDFDGTHKAPNPNLQGIANKLDGTKAAVLGARAHDRNQHGDKTSTHRTRRKFTYVQVTE